MAKSEKTILYVLFPEVRAQLLRTLFALPLKQRYVRELARTSELSLHTVQDELRKLSAIRVLTSSSNGYQRFYRANPQHPLYAQLVQIIQASEKLPVPKRSALYRLPSRRRAKKRSSKKSHLRDERPVNWHLFSKRVIT